MDYLKLTISNVNEETQELLIAQLGEQAFTGFEQKENYLLAYAEDQTVDSKDIEEILSSQKFTSELIPEVNWNEQWERDFEPIILGNEVAIRAHFHKKIKTVKHEIIVTPKMSFGTGHHATTQLMMEQMLRLDLRGKKVLDYGTGTGVLAIYAELLGAAEIIANDIDPRSEENAQENAKRNECQQIDIRLGGLDIIVESGFDCILANINLNVLKESMGLLFEKLKKGAQGLVISGVLQDNENDIIKIINIYSNDYQIIKKDKWLCICVKF